MKKLMLLDLGLTLAVFFFFSSGGEEMLPLFLSRLFLPSIRKSFPTFPVPTDYQHPALWRKVLQMISFFVILLG